MTPWRRRLRRLRLALTVFSASAIILLAMLVGLVQLLLPLVSRYPDRVAAFLSERMQRPVSVDSVAGAWEGPGPVLRLSGVHIAGSTPDAAPFVIPQAELVLDFGAWWKKNRRWNEFRLSGLDLTLDRGADGRWQLRGFSATSTPDADDADNPLLSLGALVLRDTHLTVKDALRQLDFGVRADELRLLNYGTSHTVLGLVRTDRNPKVPAQVIGRYDRDTRDGDFYLGGSDVDLAGLVNGFDLDGERLAAGRGRVQLWGSLRAAQLESAHAAFDLSGIAVTPADAQLAALPGFGRLAHLAGVGRWQRGESGWSLDVADLRASRSTVDPAPSAFRVVYTRRDDAPGRFDVTAQRLEISTLSSIAGLPGALGSDVRRLLHAGEPHGRLTNVELHYGTPEELDYRAEFADVGMKPVERVPGIDALSGSVLGDAQAGVATLPIQPAVVRYPHQFREPFDFTRFGGDVAFFRTDAAWRIETPALTFDSKGFGGELRGGVELPDDHGRPLLDLAADVTHADVVATRQFWPASMPRSSVKWLDKSMVGGRIETAHAVVYGDLADWPFRNLAGRFSAFATVVDATLDYHPEWPRATNIDAVAEFVNVGMHAEAENVTAAGMTITRAVADIPNFDDTVLSMQVEGSGTGPQLLAFVNGSPVGKKHAEDLRGLSIGGKGEFQFTLELPVKHTDELKLAGSLQLVDAALDQPPNRVHFDAANGPLTFSQGGFHAGPLAVGYRGHPATLDLFVGRDYVSTQEHGVEARLSGRLPMDAVFAEADALKPLWVFFPGASDWHVAMDAGAKGTQLTLSSDLRGTRIDLPAPLAKSAEQTLPATVTLPLPQAGASLHVALGDVLRLNARLPDAKRPLALAVNFDDTLPEQLPESGMLIGGHPRAIDVSGWTTFAFGNGSGGTPLRGVDVTANDANIFGRDFSDLRVRVKPGAESNVVDFSGESLEGRLELPAGGALGTRGITATLARLHWPEAPPGEVDDGATPAAFMPAVLPPLHVTIDDFRLGEARFGRAQLESHPTPQGMRFEKVVSDSDDIKMRASGDWNGDLRGTRSDFVIDFAAEDLGRMLGAFGYAGIVDGGKTQSHIAASWPGSPSAFALAKLDGTLKISVAEGRIPDVNTPAMGRIFGLFSLADIPRRLSLDFGDFFKSGFSFNAITGEFQLREGSAFTQNLHISSPAADIRITGRTGLKVKDYDQQMVVTPHVGGALPVVGAIAGGPAGAAAGLAVQTLFNRAINHVATARYHVTGSWDKPTITLVAKEGTRRPIEVKQPEPPKPKSG